MNYERTKQKLELLKNALVCACLFVVLCGSCVSSQRASTVLEKTMRLQHVMQEAAERNGINVGEVDETNEPVEIDE